MTSHPLPPDSIEGGSAPPRGEFATVGYEIDLPDDWIAVPGQFPCGPWPDAQAWADELAWEAVGDDADDRAKFESVALSLATTVPPLVDHVLWFAPLNGCTMGVAHLRVRELEHGVDTLSVRTFLESEAIAGAQVMVHPSETFGTIGQAISLAPTGSTMAGVDDAPARVRTFAVGHGGAFVLEAVSSDLISLEIMQRSMVDVVESIREFTA